jgi:AraC-like DNA-binding protein
MTVISFSVPTGGLHRCDPGWNLPLPHPSGFHRVYVPISGAARYALGDEWTELRPGRLYFIPAHHANRQECRAEMRVHWLHLTIAAPQLAQRLARLGSIVWWPEREWSWWRPTYRRIVEHIAGGGGPALGAAVHAFALAVAAAAAERAPAEEQGLTRARERFAPALELIERRFPRPPAVSALAAACSMSAVHFRRSFRSAFGVAPHAFVARRRLERAAVLLIDAGRSVAEVASDCGYDDPFYFSRAFRRHHHASPAAFRRARQRAP